MSGRMRRGARMEKMEEWSWKKRIVEMVVLHMYATVSIKLPIQANFTQIDFAGIDDSDSDSSSGVEDNNGLHNADEGEADAEDEDEDEEDIPISDLEDLDDEVKEDIIP